MNIFTGDLYSMYTCSFASNRVSFMYNYYIRNSLWVAAILDIWSSQTGTFQQNKGPPKWSISFHIVLKKWVFQAHRRVPPTTGVGELWKKNYFTMKTNELRWHSFKNWWIFSLGTYLVLQGIGSPSCIIIKYVIPFGEQQSWMSEVRRLERFNQKQVPRNDQFLFILYKKKSFSSSPKGTPHERCRRTMKKTSLQWKLTELGGIPSKSDEYFHWGPIFYVCSSARNRVPFMYNY